MNFAEKVYYKFKIDAIWNRTTSMIDRLFWTPFHIMSAAETVEFVLKNKCSVARFGDGELHIAAYGCALRFQRSDPELQRRLNQVVGSQNERLLICLPKRINAVSRKERKKLPPFWQQALEIHLHPWLKNFSRIRCYGDTNMSRIVDCNSMQEQIEKVRLVKSLWKNRNVIMVEGEKTRFGVGNDLFDQVLSVYRILGPAESAFDYFGQLLKACLMLSKDIEDPLFLLALGPTATVLASDLADHGVQAIDIGHLDISYEKVLRNSNERVPGKYTNESLGGNLVEECNDPDYLSQIVFRIGIEP